MRVVVIPAFLQPTASDAAAPSLQPGDVVDGKVLQTLVDGRVRIMLANTILDLTDPGNLVPGTTLRLQVAGSASALQFIVLDQIPAKSTADAALATIAAASGASATAAADTASAQKLSALGSTAQPPEPAAALAAAVATAVARQSSLAPLFADTALAATLDQLPAPVRDAASQLLALRPPLDENLSAAAVKQAFTSSGLLLEARLALASQALAPPPSASDDLKAALSVFRSLLASYLGTVDAQPAVSGLSNPGPASAAPLAATPAAATPASEPLPAGPQAAPVPQPSLGTLPTQDGAPPTEAGALPMQPGESPAPPVSAPLAAAAPLSVGAVSAAAPQPLPEPLRDAAGRSLISRPSSDEGLAADPEQAREGARPMPAARPSTPSPQLAPLPVAPADLKAVLGVLRSTLARATEPDAAAPAASDPADATPASVPQSVARPPGAPAAPPPPPYRGSPPTAQAAVAPSIGPDNAPRDVAKVLMSGVDGALARHVLLQVASLPERTDVHVGDGSAARWTFEVPFALPQGTTIAQLEIARDGGQEGPANAPKPVWRARFSVDLESIGPVHALVTFNGTLNRTSNGTPNGGRTTVTLWAERPETSAQLRADVGGLTQALRGAELDPGDVLVRDGAPPRRRNALPAGHFLDRAT